MRPTYSWIFTVSSRTGQGCSAKVSSALSGISRRAGVELLTVCTLGPATYHGWVSDTPDGRPKKVLLAAPRGYCAGVDRAVITVEKALDLYGAPVYVRKQIVHNKHVVADLEARGAIFVEELDEVPEGQTVVFSAHGVSPEVHRQADQRSLKTI